MISVHIRALSRRYRREDDDTVRYRPLQRARYEVLHVVNEVALHAVNHLKIGVFRNPSFPPEGFVCLRKGLYNSVSVMARACMPK